MVLILSSDDGRTGEGGTGSIISAEGKVITNGHVILNDSGKPFRTIYVFLKPDKVSGDNTQDLKQRFTAHVLQFSPPGELDLALPANRRRAERSSGDANRQPRQRERG